MLADKTLAGFVDAVADRTPAPGGGSVAALVAALGAALGVMVARFSEGGIVRDAGERLRALADEFILLLDRDAEAYGRVHEATRLPKSTPEEKKRRAAAVQEALAGAAEVPLQGVGLALKGMHWLGEIKSGGNPRLVSDSAMAAQLLYAGGEACRLNVLVNLKEIRDPAVIARYRADLRPWETQGRAMQEWFIAAVRLLEEAQTG